MSARLNLLTIGIVTCLLTSCAAQTTNMGSTKAADITFEPKRILVLQSMGSTLPPGQAEIFQKALAEYLGVCGITSAFAIRNFENNSLSLETNYKYTTRSDPEKIKSLKPDSLLMVDEYSLRKRGSAVVEITYMIELADSSTRKVVWKTNISLSPSLSFNNSEYENATSLANGIMSQLVQDGIVHGCPPRH
jgi:hypothetical protein